MIIALILSDVEQIEDIFCLPSEKIELILRAQQGKVRYREYRYIINHKELTLQLPLLTIDGRQVLVMPAVKLPRRPYPVYVYLFAVGYYLTHDCGQRTVAALTGRKFGIPNFSHSSISRALKWLCHEVDVFSEGLKCMVGPDPAFEWAGLSRNARKQVQIKRVLPVLAAVWRDIHAAIDLAYRFFNATGRLLFEKRIVFD